MNAVAKCFGASAHSYHQKATLQQELGHELLGLMEGVCAKTILDLGCGPGLFFHQLKSMSEHVISMDLAYSMLKQNSSNQVKVQCDSQAIAIQDDAVDLVFSNLMIQWCDFKTVLDEIHRVLKPGGVAVISTLLPGSLFELETAWQSVDDDNHVHQYQPLDQLINAIKNKQWRYTQYTQKEFVYYYDNAIGLARELKSLGANHVQGRQRSSLMSKGAWNKMEAAYKAQFSHKQTDKISATYKALTIRVQK